jgi:predicted anti-sigma-YlaC factor YlaD
MLKRIIWPAVVAGMMPILSIICAALGNGELAIATGLAGVTFAILASNEKR